MNLIGGIMALAMLTIAARPADSDHEYGHGKAEYFSSGLEGALILVAAVAIGVAAVSRFITPQPLADVGVGIVVSAVASVINLAAALLILRVGRKHASITLEANARHLITDVWTSLGVIVGVGTVGLTQWQWLDPAVALIVAANIVRTGTHIVQQSVEGLMDSTLSAADLAAVRAVLATHEAADVQFHALRTRRSGARKFVSVHVLVPGTWTVQRGHELLEDIERDMRRSVAGAVVFTHLESLDDPASWDDEALERRSAAASRTP